MKDEHKFLIQELEKAFSKLENKETASQLENEPVSFSKYRSVILALRRCQIILEDILPYLPTDKQNDVKIYLNVLGDMNCDVATYSKIDYLKEFVLPVEQPYRTRYADINDPTFSPRHYLEEMGVVKPVSKKKPRTRTTNRLVVKKNKGKSR